jgi:glutaredoxin
MKTPHALIRCLTAALLLGSLGALHAQAVYRIVGPDGRVTYSDQPPPADAKATQVGASGGSTAAIAQLPFELRQAASKYPVTLYSGNDCAPCGSGRNLLNARGIPYSEKTVIGDADGQALKRLSGESTLPFLTIGGQQIKGFSDTEWNQFLDAAGYPRQSRLPAGYQRPAATPLVASRAAPAAVDTRETAAPERRTRAVSGAGESPAIQPAPSNPAGIRF